MPRKLLIVDDNEINREMLINTLKSDYEVIVADGGEKALRLINLNYKHLSAILTDIQMPDIDGYEVLRRVRENPALSSIPVIMVTGTEDEKSRLKALTLGANDFIVKPFSPEIVKHCVKNNIALRETASVLNAIQKDKLTGLYNREAFFDKVNEAVKDRAPGYYIMSCFDVDNFKLINDRFGNAEGDRILYEIGKTVSEDMDNIGGIAGRISGDNFAVLIPTSKKEMSISNIVAHDRMAFSDKQAIVFSIGRYVVTDLTLSASAICDRAFIAKQSVKGRYDTHIAYFDNEMLEKLVRSQQIAAEMDTAVSECQFEVWFQPQHNHSTGSLIGAEALVRWRHPLKGLISPYEFIPVFEKNGFIYELDKYVWEEVCVCLRRWIDSGLNPVPVSVNVSRVDILRTDFIEVITGLVKKYKLPEDLLRLEITESVFSQSAMQIVETVQLLVDNGFTVEIDDFGSGYSSLNTLKSVPAQVVKLDMRFLEDNDDSGRGGNILESIVRMTKWLGMTVIAEGVETKEQADYLTSVGCTYIQGYFYARPMPVSDYEKYCKNEGNENNLSDINTVAHMNKNSFWSPESIDTLIFNNYIGAACIFEYYKGHIELLRSNTKFTEILGTGALSIEDTLKLNWISHLTPESLSLVRDVLQKSATDLKEYTNEYTFLNINKDNPLTCLRSTMRVIATTEDRMLVYCTSENITKMKEVEQREHVAYEQIKMMIHDMPSGYAQMLVHQDGHLSLVNFNDTFCYLREMTRDELIEAEGSDSMKLVHPNDAEAVAKAVSKSLPNGGTVNMKYRLKCGSGNYKWFSVFGRKSHDKNNNTVINAYYSDIDIQVKEEESEKALMDNLPVGAGIYEFVNGQMSLIYQNKVYWELVGLNEEKYPDASEMSAIHPDDIPVVMNDLSSAIQEHRDVSCDIRLRHLTCGYRHVSLSGRVVFQKNGGFLIYATFTPISDVVMEARNHQARLTLLTNSIPGGIAAYEGRPDEPEKIKLTYFSDGFCKLFGYTREEYEKLASTNPLGMIFAGDMKKIKVAVSALVHDGTPLDYIYRTKVNGGNNKWINVRAVIGEPSGNNLTAHAVFFDVTAQKEASEKLRVSEEVNRLAIGLSNNIVCRYDIVSKKLAISNKVNPAFKLSPIEEDVPYKAIREGLISSDTAEAFKEFFEKMISGEASGNALFQLKATDGWHWVDGSFTVIFSEDKKPLTSVISFIDVTEKIERNMAYRRWQQAIEDKKPEAYSIFLCNITKDSIVGESDGMLISSEGTPLSKVFSEWNLEYADCCVCGEDRNRFLSVMDRSILLLRHRQGRNSDSLDFRERLSDGKYRWLRLTVDLVELQSSRNVEAYVMFENIDREKRAEIEIQTRAETDPLTGLLNRNTFEKKITQMIETRRQYELSALFIIDLDGFKLINDTFGHSVGDSTLIELSDKLRRLFRTQDLVCRLGGDEFLIYMQSFIDNDTLKSKAEAVCSTLHKSFSSEIVLSASVGISVCPDSGVDFEELYQKADIALYHIKETGKNGYAVYSDRMGGKPHSEQNPPTVSLDVPVRDEKKRRMLIVDDNKISREYLSKLFCNEFTIDTATEGTAALAKLRRYGTGISIVLLDLVMPGLDGFAILKKMRESQTMQTIPVIVVSGMNEREISLKAIKDGASDYITKPVDADILKLRVAAALSRSENEQLRAKNRYLSIQNEETKRMAELKQHNEELSAALHNSEHIDYAKGQFLSSMSHEIRTPLNAIIGYNTIAKDELNLAKTDLERRVVSMKVMDCLTKSEVASRHLLNILNDVLDISAIEAGKMKVKKDAFDFKNLISSLTVLFFSQAHTKGVGFEVQLDMPAEEWFIGDQLRINQILTNLLSNAVKFTPENGNVTLSVKETVLDDVSAEFVFTVTDTGIGMTQEYLTHIWTPFEQEEESISRRFGGTGLGLSITKNLVEMMNGTITVKSESGVGSEFTVKLILTRMKQPEMPVEYEFPDINALVVDDDTSTCDYIKLLFDRCGIHCTAFTSGKEAVSAFAAAKESDTPFNICLVDWRMPGMDGFSVISEMRRISGKEVPIVVVTAYDFSEVSDKAEELGINKFISKPLFQSSLFDMMTNIYGHKAQIKAKEPAIHFKGVRILLVEDNNMNMEVAKHILLSAGIEVDSAWNGREAVDIFCASHKDTYKAILMDIHMPELDGYAATRMIRTSSHPNAHNIPVIAMTADVFAEDITEAHNVGMNDHIAKPIETDVLFSVLKRYLSDDCI